MKRILTITIALVLAAGCQNTTMEQAKAQAQQRWYHTRAQLLCGVAKEHLKNGQLDQAAAKAQEALSLEGNSTEARMLLGKAYIGQGEYAVAAVELKRVVQQEPTAPDPLYLLAVAQERNGELQIALENYRKAQALALGNIEPAKAAAEVLIQLDRKDEARLYLENYANSAGSDPGFYELAARLAAMTHDYAKAVRYYQRAHDLDPANLQYRESLGETQLINGNYVDAVETFGDLLTDKKYTPTATIYCRLGQCHIALKNPQDARDDFYKAGELSPEVADVWAGLAQAALLCDDAQRAVLSARKAMELQPDNPDTTALLGYALLRGGKIADARALLIQAAKTNPQSSLLQCVLGRAYAAGGNGAKAAKCYREAMRLDPESSLARELFAQSEPNKTRAKS